MARSIEYRAEQVIRQYHSVLLSELDRAEVLLGVKRPYDAGQVLEVALGNVLKQVLPQWAGVTRGVVVDRAFKEQSREIDIIIFDNRYFAGFPVTSRRAGLFSVVPVDVVLAAISVKKTLVKSAFLDAVGTLNSVLDLPRKRFSNRLHFDMELGAGIKWDRAGIDSILTAVVGFDNQLSPSWKSRLGKAGNDDLTTSFDDLASKEWLKGIRCDLIYTVDGVLFFPAVFSEGQTAFTREWGPQMLERPKSFPQVLFDGERRTLKAAPGTFFFHAGSLLRPELALGQLFACILSVVGQLVRCTPDVNSAFEECFKLKSHGALPKQFRAPSSARSRSSAPKRS